MNPNARFTSAEPIDCRQARRGWHPGAGDDEDLSAPAERGLRHIVEQVVNRGVREASLADPAGHRLDRTGDLAIRLYQERIDPPAQRGGIEGQP